MEKRVAVPAARVVLAQMATAAVMGVRLPALRGKRRGTPRICLARHVAMYVCHLVLGMSQSAVARAFGRERKAVHRAVRRIAEARADPELDRTLLWVEASLREAVHG